MRNRRVNLGLTQIWCSVLQPSYILTFFYGGYRWHHGFHAEIFCRQGLRPIKSSLMAIRSVIACELVAIRSLRHLPKAERPPRLPPLILPAFSPQPAAETPI